ncbi:puromycin-sensitive aminopeptidase-like isoform X3, partial [Leptotrombidium deliense]
MPSGSSEVKQPFCRLPTNVVPTVYDLTFTPDLTTFSFTGETSITVNIKDAVDQVTLNVADLDINEALFSPKEGEELIKVKELSISPETETVIVKFPFTLEPGEVKLLFKYTGTINDKMKGFYRSQYKSLEGEVRYSASTHFESTNARRAFPCFDEPALKARFNVTLVVPKDRLALSNMQVVKETLQGNLKVVKFATSPLMSTYLVCFVIGEYDFVEGRCDDVTVRVYTPLGKKEQGQFALDFSLKALPYYSNYFKIPYPLPKLDLIAIANFAIGAMENWGLITFREMRLLFDPENSSLRNKQQIANTVAHEISHMWFGNLVTMEWFTQIWLNEGFATFIADLSVGNVFPEFQIWTQFVETVVESGLNLDASHNSHPVEVAINSPCEIGEIYDRISYEKGASIIRMLHDYIGNEVLNYLLRLSYFYLVVFDLFQYFGQGINLYLKRHSYKNTITEDLWDALEETSKLPIASVMNTWTKQKGFPVITVSSRQDGNNKILTVTQEKFCANGKLNDYDNEVLWMVPISVSTQWDPSSETVRFLLESRTTQIVLSEVPANYWVKLNHGAVGFYRVNYSSEMLSQILPAVSDKSMPVIDRYNVVSDLFAMTKAGKASTVDLLKCLEACSDEDDYTVWQMIDICLSELSNILSFTDFDENFCSFGKRILIKIFHKLGWDAKKNETYLNSLLRPVVLNRLVSFNDEEVIQEAQRRFEASEKGVYVVPADIRYAVYRAVAKNADDKIFDAMLSLFRYAELNEEKLRILVSLGAVIDPIKIQRLLEYSISDD